MPGVGVICQCKWALFSNNWLDLWARNYIVVDTGLASYKHRLLITDIHGSNGMFLCSKLVTASLCYVNAGNGDIIILPQLQERKMKNCWAQSRGPATWGTAWCFPCVPSLSIFWSWSLFVQITAGIQHTIPTFSLPFLGLTTLFIALVDSLGPSASSYT